MDQQFINFNKLTLGKLINFIITNKIIIIMNYSAFPSFWIFLVGFIGAIEAKSISTNWIPLGETLKETSYLAKLKATATPGDLSFDPLGNIIILIPLIIYYIHIF